MSLNIPTGHPFHLARHLLLGLLPLSLACGDQGPPGPVPVATLGQGLDSDSDGMDDAWETTYFGNLSRNGTGDYDSDGMTDLEEYQNTFDPTAKRRAG